MLCPEILLSAVGISWHLVVTCCQGLAGKWCKQPGKGKPVCSVSLTALHASHFLHPGQLLSSSSPGSYRDVVFPYMRSSTLVSPRVPRTASLSWPSWGFIPRPAKSALLFLFVSCHCPMFCQQWEDMPENTSPFEASILVHIYSWPQLDSRRSSVIVFITRLQWDNLK